VQSGSHRTALDSASREKLNVDVESLQASDHVPVHCYFTRTVLPAARGRWAPVWPRRAASGHERLVLSSGDHRAYYSGSSQPASRRNSAGVVNRVWAAQFLSTQALTWISALQPGEPPEQALSSASSDSTEPVVSRMFPRFERPAGSAILSAESSRVRRGGDSRLPLPSFPAALLPAAACNLPLISMMASASISPSTRRAQLRDQIQATKRPVVDYSRGPRIGTRELVSCEFLP
jgi:hypothetical protein